VRFFIIAQRTHIPVRFWGGVDRNTVSNWKCRREKDDFVLQGYRLSCNASGPTYGSANGFLPLSGRHSPEAIFPL